jgi:electron transfer flavoprotein-quinone oxidoreductase
MEEKFDVIIVGAGMAGNAAALRLARHGLQVALIERGPYPGSKNVSGGVLYGHVLNQLIPNFWQEAPVERQITNQITTFMTEQTSFSIDYKSSEIDPSSPNAFTVLRARFDPWLAAKAEQAGAILVPGIRVDRVIRDGQQVVGVAAGEEEMFADVVIAADGANSFIAQEAGLRGRLPSAQVSVGVKQIIGLPRETIEERFHLTRNEGTAYSLVGYATQGISGGGFLYTNLDSLSIGLVMKVDDLVDKRVQSGEIMEDFLQHPTIQPLIRGGQLLEYSAHLIPEGGIHMIPQLFTGGMLVVGDAAGFGINNGFVVRGMDLAIGSAIAAADCIIEAHARNDFSSESMSAYKRYLDRSFVLADMRTYAQTPTFFENQRLYRTYPDLLSNIMSQIYEEKAQPKTHLFSILTHGVRKTGVSLMDLAHDVILGIRTL